MTEVVPSDTRNIDSVTNSMDATTSVTNVNCLDYLMDQHLLIMLLSSTY